MPAPADTALIRSLIDDIRRAPATMASVVDFMDRIARAAGAEGAALLQCEKRTPDFPHTASLQELVSVYFRDGWNTRDLRMNMSEKLARVGVAVDQDFATPELMARAPYYTEFLVPNGFRWSCGLKVETGATPWYLVLQRTPRQGLFDRHEQQAIKLLAPAFDALCTNVAVMGRTFVDGFRGGLATSGKAVITLDQLGSVREMNSLAETLDPAVLSVQNKRILCSDRASASALNDLVAALRPAAGRPPTPPKHVVVSYEGVPRYVVQPIVLAVDQASCFAEAHAILVIEDLAQPIDAHLSDLLPGMFRFTPREVEFAIELAKGRSLAEIARTMKVARTTARDYLRSMFSKTDTRRQQDLVALLTRLAVIRMPQRS